jgi:hypothetical protein
LPSLCQRTFTVTNTGPELLTSIKLLLTWDFDVTPNPGNERIFLKSMVAGSVISYGALPNPSPSLLTWDGQLKPFTNADMPCSTQANAQQSFATSPCDFGASVILALPNLKPKEYVEVITELRLFNTVAAFNTYEQSVLSNTVFLGAAHSENAVGFASDDEVIAVRIPRFSPASDFAPPKTPTPEAAIVPTGTCPCLNGGKCQYGVVGPCICPPQYTDTAPNTLLCSTFCKNGVVTATGECVCYEGWYTKLGQGPFRTECADPCNCMRGSHCNYKTGECFCKNGLSGSKCDKFPFCAKGSQ